MLGCAFEVILLFRVFSRYTQWCRYINSTISLQYLYSVILVSEDTIVTLTNDISTLFCRFKKKYEIKEVYLKTDIRAYVNC